MTLNAKIGFRLLICALLWTTPSFGQSPTVAIADGQPWKATLPNGDKAQMTFMPDGTIKAKRGFFTIRMTWTPTADGMCMQGGPGGDRCMVIQSEGVGYVGRNDNKVVLIITR